MDAGGASKPSWLAAARGWTCLGTIPLLHRAIPLEPGHFKKPHTGSPARNQGDLRPLMMMEPRTVERLLGYMGKGVWLIIAYSFGTMVGRLILLAQNT